MKEDQQPNDLLFTRRGAWMGLIAYLVVVLIVVLTFV